MTHPVDKFVGQKVRSQRKLMGLTQQQLAESVGIKFQQIQKYETGANRISASKLWDISKTLGVPVAFFFEGYEGETSSQDENFEVTRDIMNVVKAYRKIPAVHRKKFFQLAQTLTE